MHRTDVVLIGPLEPLLRRPLRVPLPLAVAITVILLCAGLVVTAILTLRPALDAALHSRCRVATAAKPKRRYWSLSRASRGDCRCSTIGDLGQTPATVSVAARSLLVLHRDGFLDAFVPASGPSLDVPLWRAQPDVRRLRPPCLASPSRRRISCRTGACADGRGVPERRAPGMGLRPDSRADVSARRRRGAGQRRPAAVAVAPDATAPPHRPPRRTWTGQPPIN